MSSPAIADGYDTPAQQREDSTPFMLLVHADYQAVPPGVAQRARGIAQAVTGSGPCRPKQTILRQRASV